MMGAATSTFTVNTIGSEAGLLKRLEGSVWLALMVCEPLFKTMFGVHAQVLFGVTIVVQIVVWASTTVSIAPATPVPLMLGRPELEVLPLTGAVMLGAAGGCAGHAVNASRTIAISPYLITKTTSRNLAVHLKRL